MLVEELSDPFSTGTHVETRCVEPFVVDEVVLQRPSSSAASSFSNLVVSWMAHRSTAEPSCDGLV